MSDVVQSLIVASDDYENANNDELKDSSVMKKKGKSLNGESDNLSRSETPDSQVIDAIYEKRHSVDVQSLNKANKSIVLPQSVLAQHVDDKQFVRKYTNYNNECVHVVPTNAFAQFEAALFDLLEFNKELSFKSEQANNSSCIKSMYEFDNSDCQAVIVPNFDELKDQLDLSVPNRPRLQRDLKEKELKGKKPGRQSELGIGELKRARIITVIANENGTRPRKAARLLVNNKTGETLEHIMHNIHIALSVDYGSLKKVYSLHGLEVKNVSDFLNEPGVFLAFGNEKIHNRDFELSPEEANVVFAKELIKSNPNPEIIKLHDRYTNPISASKISLRDRNDLNASSIISYQLDSDRFPDELLENYMIGNIIGEGKYSSVYECSDINTSILFALKVIDMQKCKGRENAIQNELKILRKAKHTNIIKLVEEYYSDNQYFLILELYKYGDIFDIISSTQRIIERDIAYMIQDLTSAIAYLHSNNIVHRDIKIENILVSGFKRKSAVMSDQVDEENLNSLKKVHKNHDGSKTLKVGDFGLAAELTSTPLDLVCGSPLYVAPEILSGKTYGSEVDIWSLGILMCLLLTGQSPFVGSTEEMFKSIKNSKVEFPSPLWDGISDDAKDLLHKMLEKDQKQRITASDILTHTWFKQIKADNKPDKQKNLHENISKNLPQTIKYIGNNLAISIIARTALDKETLNVPKFD